MKKLNSILNTIDTSCFGLNKKNINTLNFGEKVEFLIMVFLSTYFAEKSFCVVQEFFSKSRNRLEICEKGDSGLIISMKSAFIKPISIY